jgi:TolA-binding protein
LGEMDRAQGVFLELMIDYPETKQAPEANFFIGYCNMLQGKYKEATEALNMVVKDCPQSSYASKARLCLTRIKRMTE